MAAFAGYYTEALLDTLGNLQKEVAFTLYVAGTNDIANVYSDRDFAGETLGDGLETSDRGIASFYATPGEYEIEIDTVRTKIVVPLDAMEPQTVLDAYIPTINEGLSTLATYEYVDEQVALVNDVDTDEFAKRNEDNNMSGFKVYNVKSQITTQTGTTYTLTPSDSGSIVRFSNASAITVTLPNSMPANTVITILQDGTGQITFSPEAGATRTNRQNHTKTAGQYAFATLVVVANSTGTSAAWRLGGDTAA